jgi:hypothetical protein
MFDITMKRGLFVTGPLSHWRFVNLGAVVPQGIILPDLPELSDDDETPPPFVERDDSSVTVHFHDVARVRVDLAGKVVTVFDIVPDTAECVIDHILLDHIAPRVLAELGELVLHASAVAFGERIALFLGETGSGKSTLATSLHQSGRPLLGDDAVAIRQTADGYVGEVVYPSLRLFPETIASLLGEGPPTSPMADYSDKQNVHLPELVGDMPPLPVAAIFFLGGDTGAQTASAAPLDSMRACIKLVEQSFTLDARDPRCAARRLAAVSQLALAVPAYTLSYPHDFSRLGDVHAVIEDIMNAPEQGHAAALQETFAP